MKPVVPLSDKIDAGSERDANANASKQSTKKSVIQSLDRHDYIGGCLTLVYANKKHRTRRMGNPERDDK